MTYIGMLVLIFVVIFCVLWVIKIEKKTDTILGISISFLICLFNTLSVFMIILAIEQPASINREKIFLETEYRNLIFRKENINSNTNIEKLNDAINWYNNEIDRIIDDKAKWGYFSWYWGQDTSVFEKIQEVSK